MADQARPRQAWTQESLRERSEAHNVAEQDHDIWMGFCNELLSILRKQTAVSVGSMQYLCTTLWILSRQESQSDHSILLLSIIAEGHKA